jgi:hypothetical protein
MARIQENRRSVGQTLNVTLGKGEGEPSRWLETSKWKS